MKKLQWVNLVGVLALTIVCVAQWQRDRRMNLELRALEKARHAQDEKIAEQEKSARGLSEDLSHFKQKFQDANTDLSTARESLRTLTKEKTQLANERDQLKTSVTNWAAAVSERDRRLKEMGEQLRDLSGRLTDSIQKFNELATNHNAAIHRFNELATNYNNVVKDLNELRTGKAK